MNRPLPARPRAAATLLLLLLSLGAASPAAAALAAQQDDPERRAAFEAFDEKKFVESLPLLEKLAAKYPSDPAVLSRYGLALFFTWPSISDPEKRKAQLARSRSLIVRAREMGFNEGSWADLVDSILASVKPDGTLTNDKKLSENEEAEREMRAGEAAFAKDDFDEALKHYSRALQLDPKLYEAALFAGDAHLGKGQLDEAGKSYARAVQINPDRETAYRYWGNTYMRQARLDEARDKYVEAIVAVPYSGYVWNNGLVRWAQAKGVRLGHPKIDPPTSVTPMKDDKMTVTIDPKALGDKSGGSGAWVWYGLARAAWAAKDFERFRKEYPAEKTYRHSLREEADALRGVVEAARNELKDGKIKQLDPMLGELVKLEEAGLLEAYVLFARADEGISHDYEGYRKTNRDKLRRYLIEYVASGKY